MQSMQGLKSPLIAEESGAEKELKLRFDVSQYSPEEIMVEFLSVLSVLFWLNQSCQVKTVDNKLLVHAKHEESGGGNQS